MFIFSIIKIFQKFYFISKNLNKIFFSSFTNNKKIKFKAEFLDLISKNNNLNFKRIRSKIVVLSFKIIIDGKNFSEIKINMERFISKKFNNLYKQDILYLKENSQEFLICIIYLSKRADIQSWKFLTFLEDNFPIIFTQENSYFFGAKESDIFSFDMPIGKLIKDLSSDSNLYKNLLERYLYNQSNIAYKNLDLYGTDHIHVGDLMTSQHVLNNFNIKIEEGNISLLKFFSSLDNILESIFEILKSKDNLVSKQILIEALTYTKIKNINQEGNPFSYYYSQWSDMIDRHILPTWKKCFFSVNFFIQRFKYFILESDSSFLSYEKGFEALFQKANIYTNIIDIKKSYLDFEKSLNLIRKTKYKPEKLKFETFILDINTFLLINFYKDVLKESLGSWMIQNIVSLFNSDLDQIYLNYNDFQYSYEDNLGNNLIYKNLVCKILENTFLSYLKAFLNLIQIENELNEVIISNFVINHNKKVVKSFYAKFKKLYTEEEFSLLIRKNSEKVINFDLNKKLWSFNDTSIKDLGEIFIDILQSTLFIEIVTVRKKCKSYSYLKMNPFLKEFGSKNFNFKLVNIPLLVEPNNWTIGNSSLVKSKFTKDPILNKSTLEFGGYLLNYCNNSLSGISESPENHGSYEIFNNSCQSLNYLATQKYYFNNDLINYQLNNSKNFFKFLFSYMDLIPKDNILDTNLNDIMYFKNNILIVRSFQSYCDIKISLKKSKINLRLSYDKYISGIKGFFSNLLIMNLFKNYIVYFPCRFDNRFRIYYFSSSITIQGNSYMKAHIEMLPRNSNMIYFTNFDSEVYLDQINSFKKKAMISKKAFNYYKFIANIDSTVFKLDAHASMIAICSALIGDLDGLMLTKIFENKDCYQNSEDFYLKISHYFYNFINYKLSNNNYFFFKGIDNKFVQAYCQLFFLINKKTTTSRDFFKSICMPYIYSESNFSRANKYLEFCKNNFGKEMESIQNSYNCPKNLVDVFVRKISYILARSFEEVFLMLYPNIYKLKMLMQKKVAKSSLLKSSKGVYLYIGCKYSSSFIPYLCRYKYIIRKFKGKIVGGALKRFSKTKLAYRNKFDSIKSSNSIFPHLIHRLDSQLLENIILNFKEHEFPIGTAHDCVYTLYQHVNFAKESFYKNFVNLLLIENPLEEFLKKNLSENEYLSKDIVNFLKESNLRRIDIISKIDSGILKMNKNILGP